MRNRNLDLSTKNKSQEIFTFVGVYGTLKQRERANHLLQNNKEVKLIGVGITKERYLLTDVGYPYLIDVSKNKILKKVFEPHLQYIEIEIYKVPIDVLEYTLDHYEGYPHHYDRKLFKVRTIDLITDGKHIESITIKDFKPYVWIYYIDLDKELKENDNNTLELIEDLYKKKEFEVIKHIVENDFGKIISNSPRYTRELKNVYDVNRKFILPKLKYSFWGNFSSIENFLKEEKERFLRAIERR